MAGPIFNMLFPDGRPEHVPIIAVCGDAPQPAVIELLRKALSEGGHAVGSATSQGLWAAGKRLSAGDATGPAGTRTILQDPRIDAVVLEIPIGVVVEQGLGIDACDIAVIGAAHRGHTGEVADTTIRAIEKPWPAWRNAQW